MSRNPTFLSVDSLDSNTYTICRKSLIATSSGRLPKKRFTEKDTGAVRSTRDSRQAKTHVDNLLFQFVDDMHLMWNADSFLDRAQELVEKAIDEQNTLLQSLTGVAQSK